MTVADGKCKQQATYLDFVQQRPQACKETSPNVREEDFFLTD